MCGSYSFDNVLPIKVYSGAVVGTNLTGYSIISFRPSPLGEQRIGETIMNLLLRKYPNLADLFVLPQEKQPIVIILRDVPHVGYLAYFPTSTEMYIGTEDKMYTIVGERYLRNGEIYRIEPKAGEYERFVLIPREAYAPMLDMFNMLARGEIPHTSTLNKIADIWRDFMRSKVIFYSYPSSEVLYMEPVTSSQNMLGMLKFVRNRELPFDFFYQFIPPSSRSPIVHIGLIPHGEALPISSPRIEQSPWREAILDMLSTLGERPELRSIPNLSSHEEIEKTLSVLCNILEIFPWKQAGGEKVLIFPCIGNPCPTLEEHINKIVREFKEGKTPVLARETARDISEEKTMLNKMLNIPLFSPSVLGSLYRDIIDIQSIVNYGDRSRIDIFLHRTGSVVEGEPKYSYYIVSGIEGRVERFWEHPSEFVYTITSVLRPSIIVTPFSWNMSDIVDLVRFLFRVVS